ncbi:MAG TPA: YbjN domain-containing protein [Thermoanaerobaculia bacterium]|nr:YbjN domain-containing protein [Thermoanaerobaculia bacterium]
MRESFTFDAQAGSGERDRGEAGDAHAQPGLKMLYHGSVAGSKVFHTPCQEAVYRQVRSYLDELVDEHFDDAEHCDFYLKYGSTVVEISIAPYDTDDAVIEILAFCVQGVEPSFELLSELLKINAEVPLGAFSMVNRDIFFSHSFLGRSLQPSQLMASLDNVATVSDEYDEKIVRRYGGQTAIERLRFGAPERELGVGTH